MHREGFGLEDPGVDGGVHIGPGLHCAAAGRTRSAAESGNPRGGGVWNDRGAQTPCEFGVTLALWWGCSRREECIDKRNAILDCGKGLEGFQHFKNFSFVSEDLFDDGLPPPHPNTKIGFPGFRTVCVCEVDLAGGGVSLALLDYHVS